MRRRTWMEGVFGQFLRESTLHGVKYIGLPDKHPCEKLFWVTAVLASLGFSIYMVSDVYRKYKDNPIIISFQPKETTVQQIPFPALTLCNVNILKTHVMGDITDFLDKEWDRFEKSNHTELGKLIQAVVLSEHMTHYCLAAPSFRRLLDETILDIFGDKDYVQEIQQDLAQVFKWKGIEGINITIDDKDDAHNMSAYRHLASHHCEDMILKCMWAREFIPCSQLFNRISTQHGGCCVFNMMPEYILRKIPENDIRAKSEMGIITEAEKHDWAQFDAENLVQEIGNIPENITYPKRQKAGGKPYGLSILINPELDLYSTCNSNDAIGFKMVANSPISFPDIVEYGVAIPPSSEVFIDIEPHVTTANASDLMDIDVDKRNCYFPDDKLANLTNFKFYSSANCMDECMARITYEKCNCVRYFMPRNASQELCGARKLNCSEEVRKNLTSTGKSGHCNECKPACTEIKYKMQLSHFPLRDNTSAYKYNISEKEVDKLANNYSIVHIFMGTDSIYAKERKRLYDISDLISNAGGLLSLTLGFSLISFVELLYFFTIRAWFQRKEDEAEEEEEDEDFYKRPRGHKDPKKLSTVKPRIMDGLEANNKMNEYYNWAMTATSTATNMLNVKSSHPAPTTQGQSFSQRKSARQRIPAFQLLSRGSEEEPTYPYLE